MGKSKPVARFYYFVLCLSAAITLSAQEVVKPDTVSSNVELEEVAVSAVQRGTVMSSLTSLKTETLTTTGLRKMACCNLSESFENSASVSVGYADAVTGVKQIQLLGLSGIYCQTLAENIPTLRGLTAANGLTFVPSSWLESVQISKGAASVVNGYESVTGQMNLEYKKPNLIEPLFINIYGDLDNHYEANLTTAFKLNDKLSTGLFAAGTLGTGMHDRNHDTFMDMPKVKYANLYNRWFYLNDEKGIQSRTGIKFFYDNRLGGQDPAHTKPVLFQSDVTNKNFTIYNKTGLALGDKEGQSLGIINSFTYHDLDARIGHNQLAATQRSYYLNVLFSSHIGSDAHRYTVGGSVSYDEYTPRIVGEETVAGAFGEYTFTAPFGMTLVAGMRMDYNSQFGWLATPRFSAKYNVNDYIVLRASAGQGRRTPLMWVDHLGLLASNRTWTVESDVELETAWNVGGNIAFTIPIWQERIATLSIDYFHTLFQNKYIADTERDRYYIFYYNSKGVNYANAWQADLNATLFKGFDLYMAFRVNNNRMTYIDGDRQYQTDMPLTSSFRGLINLSYATRLRRWVFDATAQLNGRTRLPGLEGYDSPKQYSPTFPILFAQVTRNSKRLDIYAGAENMLNYKQDNPILSWDHPAGKDFDASRIWGPISGIRIYAGIRLRVGKLY